MVKNTKGGSSHKKLARKKEDEAKIVKVDIDVDFKFLRSNNLKLSFNQISQKNKKVLLIIMTLVVFMILFITFT